MKYLQALRQRLAQEARGGPPGSSAPEKPREPRNPKHEPVGEGFPGFLGSKHLQSPSVLTDRGDVHSPTCPARLARPSGSDPLDARWQAELLGWPEGDQEAWEERAAIMEVMAGKERIIAERDAFRDVATRRCTIPIPGEADDFWSRIDGWLRHYGFTEVHPSELDVHAILP